MLFHWNNCKCVITPVICFLFCPAIVLNTQSRNLKTFIASQFYHRQRRVWNHCRACNIVGLIVRSLFGGCMSSSDPLQVLPQSKHLHKRWGNSTLLRVMHDLLSLNGWTGDFSKAKPVSPEGWDGPAVTNRDQWIDLPCRGPACALLLTGSLHIIRGVLTDENWISTKREKRSNGCSKERSILSLMYLFIYK